MDTETSLTGFPGESSGPDLPFEQTQNLGKIQVVVEHVNLVKRPITLAPKTAPITMINEVPEKALKGRPIDTVVR